LIQSTKVANTWNWNSKIIAEILEVSGTIGEKFTTRMIYTKLLGCKPLVRT